MKKRKPTSFKTLTFKLSKRQMKSLKNYCRARKTTPIKLIKRQIRSYTELYAESVPEKFYATDNQLDIFEAAETENQTIDSDTQKPDSPSLQFPDYKNR